MTPDQLIEKLADGSTSGVIYSMKKSKIGGV